MLFYAVPTLSLLVVTVLARPSTVSSFRRSLTPDNTCGNIGGGANNGYTCDASLPRGGPCCSFAGYCGSTAAYCGSGCQPSFGTCGTPSKSSSMSAAPPKSTTTLPVPVITVTPPSPYSAGPPSKSGCVWVVPEAGHFTHHQKFDFSGMTTLPPGLNFEGDFIGAGVARFSQQYTSENIVVAGGNLQLKVPGGQSSSPITGAQVLTSDQDILYGSVRTVAMVSSVPGTCHGFFSYKNDNQESDIEILTGDLSLVHYTNQACTVGQKSTHTVGNLPVNATTTMHEYRLDWLPGKTVYYLDGIKQAELESNVPSTASSWIWNNWSNGDDGWSAGPPQQDNVLKIAKIEMWYNRTGSRESC